MLKQGKKAYMVTGIVGLFILLGMVGLFMINVTASPPEDTRMVVEYTHHTYIAPPCFEQAETTNNIGETTLSDAREMGYTPESECTEQALQGEQQPVIDIVLEKMGFKESQWDW